MDLHIHTCLSPCGEDDMTPCNIAVAAKENGMDAIAVCDHNSSENVIAVRAAAEMKGIKVLGGMEVTTEEEVHIVTLFDNDEDLFAMQEAVYENLPGENDPDYFGPQAVMNAEDEKIGENKKLLIGATKLSVQQVVDLAHEHSGMAIASHIDRQGFGIIGQLGFIPPDLPLDALEISPRISYGEAMDTLPVEGYPIITSSDAHRPGDIGKSYTTFLIKEINLKEMKKAFTGEGGRKVFLS